MQEAYLNTGAAIEIKMGSYDPNNYQEVYDEETAQALEAQNSLFIILLSQSASLIFTLLRGTVPSFPPLLLAIMVLAGILGGVVGRRINKRIDAKAVRKLLVGLILVIIFICCYNTWQYCH